jgi:serine/threonine-protein kinase
MPVDQALIDLAHGSLNTTDVQALRTGGQKTVRLVEREGERLVLKVVAVESGAPATLRRAQREVELLQEINSDRVVRIASELIELDEPLRGVAWLEQYLDGDDLGDLVDHRWDWAEAKAMAIDVADGLHELHSRRVVHRDLSPNNIRRTGDGRFVVMDPGFARHTLRSGLTAGLQPGTPGYLSPEHLQAYSGVPTAASDVFCVGILAFLVLTMQLPIPYSGDVSDYIQRLARVETEDIEASRPDLNGERCSVIRRMLHPQPARRYRNGGRLSEALDAVA